jgi:5'-methylthioadenosine phosphorylase
MIVESAAQAGVEVVARGTYAAVQGPRLETAAEIDRLERDGAHLVGMTGMPEAALARELEVPYAALAVVANAAAGRGASAQSVSLEEISNVLREAMERVRRVAGKVAERHGRP